MNRKFKFERGPTWHGPFFFTFGNFQFEISTAKSKGWINIKGYHSRVVGFAGWAIHVIPNLAAYVAQENEPYDPEPA